MNQIQWTQDLNTGIDVIDKQHQRIVEYINKLGLAHQSPNAQEEIGQVIDDLIDYTVSHFVFEESLQEDANYPFVKAHRRVHELFIKRVTSFQERYRLGEDVSAELHNLLRAWLINHIKRDDVDYVQSVRASLENQIPNLRGGLFRRLFS